MALSASLQALLDRFHAGRPTALARAISLVEDEREGFQDFMHEVLKVGPRTARVGFTGPPGAGKSSIVATLATAYRARGEDVGVVAVDPTSPFSGGALLGDRIRMNELTTDAGIFIRSMATRGSLGGLATTTKEVMDLMDAFGFARVLVESVGVGQTELEITAAADTVVVVLVPESGDAIQAMKAGLMEIADVFVVNKADREGVERLVGAVRAMLSMANGVEAVPEIVQTVATTEQGTDALLSAVLAFRQRAGASGALARKRRQRMQRQLEDAVRQVLMGRVLKQVLTPSETEGIVERLARRELDPFTAADEVIRRLGLS
jgi:LAO/AO transport system kinase